MCLKKVTWFSVLFCITNVGFLLLELSDESDSETPDREQATALLMAGRHLPESLMSCPGDRATLISEASRLYEVLGDKKSVQSCRRTLMLLEETSQSQAPTLQC